ncbi:MAG: metal-dependent hydrolase [Planctomycetota bacterium]
MDSVSQFVLGSSVATVALGKHVSPRRAALWGGVLGTLPDLDVLIDHGDAIADMIRHRAESHALLWMTLAAPLAAWGIAALHRERRIYWRWLLAVWLAWITHAVLDALTVYGTRLWLPFDATPVSIGSLFVVDPVYTLPLLIGTLWLLFARSHHRARRWNRIALAVSTAYAMWSLIAQSLATDAAKDSLRVQGIEANTLIVSPAPLQTVLWRALAVADEYAWEGYRSLLDNDQPMQWRRIERQPELLQDAATHAQVLALREFANDAVKAHQDGSTVLVSDLRMGDEPNYVFTFEVGTKHGAEPMAPRQKATKRPFSQNMNRGPAWLWRRIRGLR